MNSQDIKLINEARTSREYVYVFHVEFSRFSDFSVSYAESPVDPSNDNILHLTRLFEYLHPEYTGKKSFQLGTSVEVRNKINKGYFGKTPATVDSWYSMVAKQINDWVLGPRGTGNLDKQPLKPIYGKRAIQRIAARIDPLRDVPGKWYSAKNEYDKYQKTYMLAGIIDADAAEATKELNKSIGDEDLLGIKDLFANL